MTAVTPEAIAAAQNADLEYGRSAGGTWLAVSEHRLAAILEAAVPHMAHAAEHLAGGLLAENTRLRALAAEILASYAKTGDGYRGRVGQVQIQRWRDQLGGSHGE